MDKLLELLAKERPVGTKGNDEIIEILQARLSEMGYAIESLPFECNVWRHGESFMKIDGKEFTIEPSPFSEPFEGARRLLAANSAEELQEIDCKDAILLLSGELTQTPLSPKDYPFYFPEEHEKIITLLESKQPAAIIAVTGETPLHGKKPFPFIEDGNFLIPSANISADVFESIKALLKDETTALITLDSSKVASKSRQLIASKFAESSEDGVKANGKIILAAHMDSKYATPGTLDNAAGLAVLLEVASSIGECAYDIDVVPFNSEEYYGANGELEYLKRLDDEKIALMINIDSPCHKNSKTAVSYYNFSETMRGIADIVMQSSSDIVKGSEWFASCHAAFALRQIPCLVATSSDSSEGGLENIHTMRDSLETVDAALVKSSAKYLADVIAGLSAMA